jgi:hypothetical protein
LGLLRPTAHGTDRFGSEDELAWLDIDLREAREQDMIAAASVDDQELAIATEFASVNNPTIAW